MCGGDIRRTVESVGSVLTGGISNVVSGVSSGRSPLDIARVVGDYSAISTLSGLGLKETYNEFVTKPKQQMEALAQQQIDAQNAAIATQKEQTRLNDLNYTRDQQRIRARAQMRARRSSAILGSNIGTSAVPSSGTKTLIGS